MKSKSKKIIAFLCAIVIAATSAANWKQAGSVNATDSENTEVTPVSLEGFTTISTDDFVDSNGNIMESKQYTSDSSFTLKELANFDETLLTLKVKFEAIGAGSRIEFWGKDDSAFCYIYPQSENQLNTNHAGPMVKDAYWDYSIENTGVPSTINEEYLLQISTQYKDYDADGKMDGVQLGLYLNGIQVRLVDMKDCNYDLFGNRLTVRVGDSPVTLTGVETAAEEEQTYVELEGYQTISAHDFVDSSKNVMKSQRHTSNSSYTLKELTSFDKTLLTFKVEFEALGSATRIEFWGKDDNAYFFVNPSSTSQLYTGQVGTMTTGDAYWSLKIADTDIESTINQEYILQISTLYKDYDGDGINDGVQMGLYLNGVRVNQVDLKDCNLDNFGNRMTIRCDGAPVKVHHVDTEEEKEPAVRLDGFRYVTLDAFVDSNGNPMESKTYTGYETFSMRELESFDHTLLTMKVKFEQLDVNARIELLGVNEDAFYYVYPLETGRLMMTPYGAMTTYYDPSYSLWLSNLPNGEVTSTINEEYILQMSFEYKENNVVQVGVYLNGAMVREFGIPECDMANFGNRLSIRCSEEAPITVSAVGTTEELDFTLLDGFQNVSVYDFVDSDGNPMVSKTYTSVESFTLAERSNYDKTLLSFKVRFETIGAGGRIEFLGMDDSAFFYLYPADISMLRFHPNAANTMTNMADPWWGLELSNLPNGTVSSTINEEFILQIATEYKTDDMVQVTVYVNGELLETYNFDSCNMDKFGNRLTIRCDESSPITISVIETEGNAHYDEQIDVRDLVAMSKAGYGLKMKSNRAKLEADANGSGTIDVKDADIVRDRLLRTLPITDKDVMPIAGFYGPYPTYDNSGVYEFVDRINEHYFKLIADAGINLITYSDLDYASRWYQNQKTLNLCDKYQIAYMVNDSNVLKYANGSEISDADISAISAQIEKYSHNRAFYGMFLVDEPWTTEYHPVRNKDMSNGINGIEKHAYLADVLKNKLNIKYSQSPLGIWAITHPWYKPMTDYYDRYLKEYCDKLYPDYLTWAYYPFDAVPEDGIPGYFLNLTIMRNYAEQEKIPMWSGIQAGGQFNDAKEWFKSESYYPTEEQFNWNVNTVLAFGAKGLSYFPIVQPEHFAYALAEDGTKAMDFARNGLISATGERNQWWYYAREINKHIAVIDEVLMNSTHEGIIVTDETIKNGDMQHVDCFKTIDDYGINAIEGNAMIGCFDYQGKTALYVVNYSMESQQNMKLTFDTAHNMTIIQNAKTSSGNMSELTLDMAAGEGVLLVLE